MSSKTSPPTGDLADAVSAARVRLAVAEAELAEVCLSYANARIEERAAEHSPRSSWPPFGRDATESGTFVSDELSLLLTRSPWETSRLLARTRRLRTSLPEVAAATHRGVIDAEQVKVIDQAARLVEDAHTLTVLDEQVVEAARERTPQQLRSWLHRFLARHEPESAEHRRQVSLADRRVSIAQSVTGIGYVTGEVSAEDAAAIDSRLSGLAWALGAADPRTEQQRRSDLFAGLLLGTTVVASPPSARSTERPSAGVLEPSGVLEVESVDPDTGELLGVQRVAVGADGERLPIATGAPAEPPGPTPWVVTEGRSARTRIGVVINLSSLLGADETPAELADRSATVPAEVVRRLAAEDDVLFTRLLTDDGGRLLDTTELGRFASARLAEAVRLRAGTCVFPTCRVPGHRCDLDHHDPVPRGPTSAANLDPLCRRHHRGKTFAGLAAHRDRDEVCWTLPTDATYRCVDEPLPLPMSRSMPLSRPSVTPGPTHQPVPTPLEERPHLDRLVPS